jgi:hypothetical protein
VWSDDQLSPLDFAVWCNNRDRGHAVDRSAGDGREPAARIAPLKIKHHASRVRLAAVHHRPHVNPIQSNLGCAGVWCGRQFVLMIGVGF